MRVVIIKGQSQYGGTRLFADHAAAAFQRQGHQVDVLDLGETDGAAAGALILAHAETARTDLVFTINIAGELRDSFGRTVCDLYGAPHVVWHTDYVLSQAARLRGTPGSTALLFVDPTQAEAVRSLYGADCYAHLDFFPHPAVGEPAPDEASVAEFVANRPIDILWSGGFQAFDPPWDLMSGQAREVFKDAFDLAMSVEWMPPHEAFDTVLVARGLDITDPANAEVREEAARIDLWVRQARRAAFLEAVAGTGLALHICGAGWEPHLHRFANATYEGPVEMDRMIELMRRSRIVLNTNGNFGAGSHERPFSASLAGAATFSDFSRYYGQVFETGRNIELFHWQDLPAGMAALKALADDPGRCLAYAREAKAITLAGHTWDRQVGQILQAADAVRR